MIDALPASAVDDPIKPSLRGWIHLVSGILAIPPVWVLVTAATPGHLRSGALIYGLSLIFLLTISGSYHTPSWSSDTRAIMRLIDHSMIFVMIGGSFTPFLLACSADIYSWFLPIIWLMALAGILRMLFFPNVSRWIKSGIYMVMGWSAIPMMGLWAEGLGIKTVALLLIGGAFSTVGGIIYAKRNPNPWPMTFGYHEIFHVTVVLACIFHYWAVWRAVT